MDVTPNINFYYVSYLLFFFFGFHDIIVRLVGETVVIAEDFRPWIPWVILPTDNIHGVPRKTLLLFRVCLDAMVPFRSLIQIALFLPFQGGEKVIFTAETVAQRNGPIFAKQALSPPVILVVN